MRPAISAVFRACPAAAGTATPPAPGRPFARVRAFRLVTGLLTALSLGMPATAAAGEPAGPWPGDPLAHERARIKPVEIGSARGQNSVFILGALVDGDNSSDIYFGGQLGVEFQLHEFGGIRISGFQDLADSEGETLAHKFSSVRIGPVLHLRPYRRVDLGAYFEGGVLVVDAVDGKSSAKAPELTTGGFINIHLDSYIHIRLELEQSWSNVEIDNVLGEHEQLVAKFGIGAVF
ncbi:MAG: hypothetical protein ACOY3X_04535 [Pseudomonadota bacterium]